MSYFKVKKITKLNELKEGDVIPESDYSNLTSEDKFIQFQFVEENLQRDPIIVKPGLWSITTINMALALEQTSFVKDNVLENFVNTKNITEKIDCFFRKLDVYKDLGIEVPKRGILLYGPPGTGKTVSISLSIKHYLEQPGTCAIIWPSDKYDASDVKDFFKTFDYSNVERLFLIIEDIGGLEIEQKRIPSTSSLLSILDNNEKIFKIPTFIIATTNFPEMFMTNLTNRPNRIDDKIEVGFPTGEARKQLLQFYGKSSVNDQDLLLIGNDKCKEFTPAHIRDVIIRSRLYDKEISNVINEMIEEIKLVKNHFEKKNGLGF